MRIKHMPKSERHATPGWLWEDCSKLHTRHATRERADGAYYEHCGSTVPSACGGRPIEEDLAPNPDGYRCQKCRDIVAGRV